MADYSVGQILQAVEWILVSDQASDTLNMRECCGGPKHARSLSAPKILIPSEVSTFYTGQMDFHVDRQMDCLTHKTNGLSNRQTDGQPDTLVKWTATRIDIRNIRHPMDCQKERHTIERQIE
jgi:hypothetical protein